jgi:hypothetical protein
MWTKIDFVAAAIGSRFPRCSLFGRGHLSPLLRSCGTLLLGAYARLQELRLLEVLLNSSVNKKAPEK